MAIRRSLSKAEAELESLFGEPEPPPKDAPITPAPKPESVAKAKPDARKVTKVAPNEAPPLPDSWPNGSAVFRDKSVSGGWPSALGIEERDGFLGRYVKRPDGGFDVWRWRQGAYTYAGASPDHMSAFSML